MGGRWAVLAGGGAAILVGAAAVAPLRPLLAMAVVAGLLALLVAHHPASLGWAAAVPLGVALAWPWIVGSDAPLGEACVDPAAPIVLRRVLLAAWAVASIALLARLHPPAASRLALRRPSGAAAVLAVAGGLLVAVGGLVAGPIVARPFFGELVYPTPASAAAPALVFGLSNGVAEELLYRGALQGWLGAALGRRPALLVQALVFGLAHAGPEVVSLLPLHVAIAGAAGVVAGLMVDRTRSLAIPIGVHVGADVALYVGLACRAAAPGVA